MMLKNEVGFVMRIQNKPYMMWFTLEQKIIILPLIQQARERYHVCSAIVELWNSRRPLVPVQKISPKNSEHI